MQRGQALIKILIGTKISDKDEALPRINDCSGPLNKLKGVCHRIRLKPDEDPTNVLQPIDCGQSILDISVGNHQA